MGGFYGPTEASGILARGRARVMTLDGTDYVIEFVGSTPLRVFGVYDPKGRDAVAGIGFIPFQDKEAAKNALLFASGFEYNIYGVTGRKSG